MAAFIPTGLVIVCGGQSVLVLFAPPVDVVKIDRVATTGFMRDKRLSRLCLFYQLPTIERQHAICMHDMYFSTVTLYK